MNTVKRLLYVLIGVVALVVAAALTPAAVLTAIAFAIGGGLLVWGLFHKRILWSLVGGLITVLSICGVFAFAPMGLSNIVGLPSRFVQAPAPVVASTCAAYDQYGQPLKSGSVWPNCVYTQRVVVEPPVGVSPVLTSVVGGQNIVVNGVTLGLLDPQMQESHAAGFYLPTGVSGSNKWTVSWPDYGTLIVGGFAVDGVENGVYKAYDSGPVEVTVANGFIVVTLDKWAPGEFCFRVGQAVTYNWAHNTVLPLTGWPTCEKQTTVVQTVPNTSSALTNTVVITTTTGVRQESGVDKPLNFEKGATVVGWRIVLDSGAKCDGGNCYLVNAPISGTVTSGVIWPTSQEVASMTAWDGLTNQP